MERANWGSPVEDHEGIMKLALQEADLAYRKGEVPVGALLTLRGEILARAHNCTISLNDPTAHAEILVIRQAAERLGNYRLAGTTLYVTLEPCIMCAGAIIQARVGEVVFGASDPKAGGVSSLYRILEDPRLNHAVAVIAGVLGEECSEILSRFFQEKRLTSKPI